MLRLGERGPRMFESNSISREFGPGGKFEEPLFAAAFRKFLESSEKPDLPSPAELMSGGAN